MGANAPAVAAPGPTSNFLVPPPMRKRLRGAGGGGGNSYEQQQQQQHQQHQHHAQESLLSPASLLVQRFAADGDDSFDTPTFGMLPRQTTLAAATRPSEGPSIALKLDFSSPSLSVLSPCLTGGMGDGGRGARDRRFPFYKFAFVLTIALLHSFQVRSTLLPSLWTRLP